MICPSCRSELEEVSRGFDGDIYCPLCWERIGNTLYDRIDTSDVSIDECDCEICQILRSGREDD